MRSLAKEEGDDNRARLARDDADNAKSSPSDLDLRDYITTLLLRERSPFSGEIFGHSYPVDTKL